MERDFMGLNSKDESIKTGCKSASDAHGGPKNNAGESRRSGIQSGGQRAPVQLTIFYRGTVNVYDDMSPEKAQAIMLLAGNGIHMSQAMNTATATTPMSPVSISPATVTGGSATVMDAQKAMSSLRRVMQSAVPQMRGASLARFLEKRKERVMASAPYSVGKSSLPGSSSTPGKGEKK